MHISSAHPTYPIWHLGYSSMQRAAEEARWVRNSANVCDKSGGAPFPHACFPHAWRASHRMRAPRKVERFLRWAADGVKDDA